MGFGYKNSRIDKGLANNTPDPRGGAIEDVSGQLTREKISQQKFNESLNSSLREQGGSSGGTEMYSYDRIVETERFDENAPRNTSPALGAPSVFNTYSVFTHPNANKLNDFFDIEGQDGLFPKYASKNQSGEGIGGRYPTYKSLLTDFDPTNDDPNIPSRIKSTPYYASDFLFAKHFERIPLNKLVTLRRFPFPTYDNLTWGENKAFKPIAQAITYFGEPTGNELKELTKMAGEIKWKELEAQVHDVEGNEQGFESTPFVGQSGRLGAGLKFLGALGSPGTQDLSGRKQANMQAAAKYNNFEYTNRVLGPVNVVSKTHVRDRGIGASNEYSINFEYTLRSYNSINPRVAMLDLCCNMLALTFNNAKFWGGANRYFPNQPQFGFLGDQKAFYGGRYGEYIGSVVKQLGDGLGKGLDMIGQLISGILSGDLSSLTGLGKKGGSALMDMQAQKTRPQVLGFHALLTGLPIGEWHLTIGNPYRPILSLGNMIVSNFEMELDGHLGIDDFPSDLKFVIKLKNGRPRDKGDLESMMSLGEGRMYYPPEGFYDVGNLSSTTGVSGISEKKTVGNIDGRTRTPKAQKTFIRAGDSRQDVEYCRKLIGTTY